MTNPIEVTLDRALINRYRHDLHYETVYVDLDDTLILRGKVNLGLVKFLYQCSNDRKRLVLLTRHTADVERTLHNYRLVGVFDEVVCVPPRPACKSQYIMGNSAILIDDSFSERDRKSTRLNSSHR